MSASWLPFLGVASRVSLSRFPLAGVAIVRAPRPPLRVGRGFGAPPVGVAPVGRPRVPGLGLGQG